MENVISKESSTCSKNQVEGEPLKAEAVLETKAETLLPTFSPILWAAEARDRPGLEAGGRTKSRQHFPPSRTSSQARRTSSYYNKEDKEDKEEETRTNKKWTRS